jgi:hypothetical protein
MLAPLPSFAAFPSLSHILYECLSVCEECGMGLTIFGKSQIKIPLVRM